MLTHAVPGWACRYASGPERPGRREQYPPGPWTSRLARLESALCDRQRPVMRGRFVSVSIASLSLSDTKRWVKVYGVWWMQSLAVKVLSSVQAQLPAMPWSP